jgi:hypothetical protein
MTVLVEDHDRRLAVRQMARRDERQHTGGRRTGGDRGDAMRPEQLRQPGLDLVHDRQPHADAGHRHPEHLRPPQALDGPFQDRRMIVQPQIGARRQIDELKSRRFIAQTIVARHLDDQIDQMMVLRLIPGRITESHGFLIVPVFVYRLFFHRNLLRLSRCLP